jgi:hypothetical protein
MGRLTDKLTYANVMATVAVFIALGGASYAATQPLSKNSVGTKQLKKNAVTTAKIKKEAVTGVKVKKGTLTGKQINASTLGTVPSAQVANGLSGAEAVHVVGAPGEPPFAPGGSGLPAFATIPLTPVGFYKDHEGVVHLEGIGKSEGEPPIVFALPPGDRPPSGKAQLFGAGSGPVFVAGSNVSSEGKDISGAVIVTGGTAALSGITFRAES